MAVAQEEETCCLEKGEKGGADKCAHTHTAMYLFVAVNNHKEEFCGFDRHETPPNQIKFLRVVRTGTLPESSEICEQCSFQYSEREYTDMFLEFWFESLNI